MSITIKDVKSCRSDWVFNDAWVTGLVSDLCDLAEEQQREIEQLQEIAKAKAEGWLKVPPCKVGDTVYTIWSELCTPGKVRLAYKCTVPTKVSRIEIKETGVFVEVEYCNMQYHENAFGKTVFLTPEEAEKALGEPTEGDEGE